MNEIWKDVPNYEVRYKVSNLGRVKSILKNGEKIMKGSMSVKGYMQYTLTMKPKYNVFTGQQLVAMAFLNHIPCGVNLVIDHINDNKLDNRVENLQIVTNRYNSYKTQGKYSSKYKGVYFVKATKKWRSHIVINNKTIHLGYFDNEYQAHLAYQKAIPEL